MNVYEILVERKNKVLRERDISLSPPQIPQRLPCPDIEPRSPCYSFMVYLMILSVPQTIQSNDRMITELESMNIKSCILIRDTISAIAWRD
jgi:hypothetical protein